MKIVWICHFSNSIVRDKIQLSKSRGWMERIVRKIFNRPVAAFADFAPWITNGILEFEHSTDFELYVISPHYGMINETEEFKKNGISYYFFRPDDQTLFGKLKRKFSGEKSLYKGNRKNILKIVRHIKPHIIHMYGAENPYYSSVALDIENKEYPFLVSLQTLMSDQEFKNNYPIGESEYNSRVGVEKSIIKKAQYIGTEIEKYRQIIWEKINPKAIIFPTFLFLSQKINISNFKKKFDFVYFAGGINKAADLAVEAFALAAQLKPQITLNIVGDTPEPFTTNLKTRIKELKLEDKIFFSGKLPTHNDVIQQIQLSKFALLPLKIDIISGTIREAMFSGLPVVTTITPGGTPTLNQKRVSVLLSDKENISSISKNMIKLIDEPGLAEDLKANALITVNEMWNNIESFNTLVSAYQYIYNHHKTGAEIPKHIAVQKDINTL
ncbi:glycosyltransferase [Haoranjiania flava]|uniref:Glycosyltransferase n=1 Tax=Haoranjiania flava TaxID=1856322 RepID=A0AAE3IN18_9BACT|nr:glycosyltransferase [Haoranjiania flava]MCU7694609.1 glycosyltransferase [Haoranjiania flava]